MDSSLVKAAHVEVVRVQVERFHILYADFFTRPETIEMANFFFDYVYNLEDKEEWEGLAYKTYEKVKNMMKETSRENIERLMELNRITDELDLRLANQMILNGWRPGDKVSQEDYIGYYKKTGDRPHREKQLEIVLFNLKKFYELAHKPISSIVIKPAGAMAKMLGVYPLFKRIEKGYYATLPVSSEIFSQFFEAVESKEWDFLKKHLSEST